MSAVGIRRPRDSLYGADDQHRAGRARRVFWHPRSPYVMFGPWPECRPPGRYKNNTPPQLMHPSRTEATRSLIIMTQSHGTTELQTAKLACQDLTPAFFPADRSWQKTSPCSRSQTVMECSASLGSPSKLYPRAPRKRSRRGYRASRMHD